MFANNYHKFIAILIFVLITLHLAKSFDGTALGDGKHADNSHPKRNSTDNYSLEAEAESKRSTRVLVPDAFPLPLVLRTSESKATKKSTKNTTNKTRKFQEKYDQDYQAAPYRPKKHQKYQSSGSKVTPIIKYVPIPVYLADAMRSMTTTTPAPLHAASSISIQDLIALNLAFSNQNKGIPTGIQHRNNLGSMGTSIMPLPFPKDYGNGNVNDHANSMTLFMPRSKLTQPKLSEPCPDKAGSNDRPEEYSGGYGDESGGQTDNGNDSYGGTGDYKPVKARNKYKKPVPQTTTPKPYGDANGGQPYPQTNTGQMPVIYPPINGGQPYGGVNAIQVTYGGKGRAQPSEEPVSDNETKAKQIAKMLEMLDKWS